MKIFILIAIFSCSTANCKEAQSTINVEISCEVRREMIFTIDLNKEITYFDGAKVAHFNMKEYASKSVYFNANNKIIVFYPKWGEASNPSLTKT